MRTILVAFIFSLCASLLLTRFFRDWAIRRNWVDDTGGRKIHTQPIPRLGGFAILIATVLPLIALGLWDNDISTAFWSDKELIVGLAGGLGVIAIIGIIDDLKGLPAVVKLGGQITAAAIAYQAGIHIDVLRLPFLDLAHLGWLSMPITIFWFVLSINAVNLIDGMDGLAGSVVALAGGTLFFMCLGEDQVVACLILISMLGGVFGFLRYNLNPASIFLGDTGSMSLGFLLATVSVHFSQKSSVVFSLVAALMILGLPIFDLSMAIFRRFLSGKKIFSADQYHIHHILLRKGYSQRQSVLFLIAFAIIFECLALFHIYSGDQLDALVLFLLMGFLTVAVRMLGYHKIIFTQRKNTVLASIQDSAEHSLQRVLDFKEELLDIGTEEALWDALTVLAKDMKWNRVEWSEDARTVFQYEIEGLQSTVHLDGLHQWEREENGRRISIQWLDEKGTLRVLDKAFIHLIVDALDAQMHRLHSSVLSQVE